MRKTVGARELKTRLGSYLQQVRAGLVLIVTDRGRPVAELRPVREDTLADDDELLDELSAAGALNGGRGTGLAPFDPVSSTGPPLSRAIEEDREDRF